MLHYRKIDKTSFVFGLDWRIAQDRNDLKSILAEGEKPVAKIVQKTDSGLLAGIAYEPVKERSLPAAMVLAQMFESAVVFVPLDDQLAWLCAVQDHLPVPGKDLVLPVENANDEALALASLFPTATLIGEIPGAAITAEDLWQGFESFLEDKESRKKLCKAWIARTKTAADHFRLALIVLLPVAAGTGYILWKQHEAERLARERAQQAAQVVQAPPEDMSAKERAERLKRAKEQFVERIRQSHGALIARIVPPEMPDWADALSKTPSKMLGYSAEKMQCTKNVCMIEWKGRKETGVKDTKIEDIVLAEEKYLLPGNVSAKDGYESQSSINIGRIMFDRNWNESRWFVKDENSLMHQRDEAIDTLLVLFRSLAHVDIEPSQAVTIQGDAEFGIEPVTVGYTVNLALLFETFDDRRVAYLKRLAEILPVEFQSLNVYFPTETMKAEGHVDATLVFPVDPVMLPKGPDDVRSAP